MSAQPCQVVVGEPLVDAPPTRPPCLGTERRVGRRRSACLLGALVAATLFCIVAINAALGADRNHSISTVNTVAIDRDARWNALWKNDRVDESQVTGFSLRKTWKPISEIARPVLAFLRGYDAIRSKLRFILSDDALVQTTDGKRVEGRHRSDGMVRLGTVRTQVSDIPWFVSVGERRFRNEDNRNDKGADEDTKENWSQTMGSVAERGRAWLSENIHRLVSAFER